MIKYTTLKHSPNQFPKLLISKCHSFIIIVSHQLVSNAYSNDLNDSIIIYKGTVIYLNPNIKYPHAISKNHKQLTLGYHSNSFNNSEFQFEPFKGFVEMEQD